MAAPVKPWQRIGTNSQNSNDIFTGNMFSQSPGASGSLDGIISSGPSGQQRPPPVPSRPPQIRNTFSGSYGGPGYGGYGGYGYGSGYPYSDGLYGNSMYGGYNSYGMNRYGYNGSYTSSSFAQQAEQSSRPAFQSIESIVQAVGSVSMMLDSTFQAVFNSFRAVIGVADQFSRMRIQLANIFSALAVIKTMKWLVRKILVLLRLRQSNGNEQLWSQAAEGVPSELSELDKMDSRGSRSSWPIIMFFGIVLGGPWLIWKFLSSVMGGQAVNWASGQDDHYAGIAEYDFDAENDDELSFRRGMKIRLAPKELQPAMRGWLLASVDGKKTGIVPANYIKLLGKVRGQRHSPINGHPAANQHCDVRMSRSTTDPLLDPQHSIIRPSKSATSQAVMDPQHSIRPSKSTADLPAVPHSNTATPQSTDFDGLYDGAAGGVQNSIAKDRGTSDTDNLDVT